MMILGFMVLYAYLVFVITLFFTKYRVFFKIAKNVPVKNRTASYVTVPTANHFAYNFYISNLIIFAILFAQLSTMESIQVDPNFHYDNFSLNNALMWIIFNIFFFFLIKCVSDDKHVRFSMDYLYILFLLFFFFLQTFLCGSFYLFFFLLEVCSMAILYKLLLTKHAPTWDLCENSSKELTSLLYFHYWASGFGSFLYMVFFSIISAQYGTMQTGMLVLLSSVRVNYAETMYCIFFVFLLSVSISLKLGFSPLHLFKFEMYGSMAIWYLFVYTVYYFIGFFLTFLSMFLKIFFLVDVNLNFFFSFFIFLNMFFFLCFLHYTVSLRWFLATSTLINGLFFFLLLLILTTF